MEASLVNNHVVKNLFVVDWKGTSDQEIMSLIDSANLSEYQWSIYNCHGSDYPDNGVVSRFKSYFNAALYIIRHRTEYDNIIIWQQMIGFIYCLLPVGGKSRANVIVTTLLYSPGRLKKGSFRLYLLKRTLVRASALLYFSSDMAQNVQNAYPAYAAKVFWTYLPIINNGEAAPRAARLQEGSAGPPSVFTGGLSDRDFESVIQAFSATDIPVTIVCSKSYVFKTPGLITGNFVIIKNVSEAQYQQLVLAASFVVIALEYEHSSCGQLLFTFAMKNGIPIIATDCFGTRDYIENNENGILVPLRDPGAIRDAYYKLVHDPDLKQKLVKRSAEIAAQMNFKSFIAKVDAIITAVSLKT